jgi:hypothetical protein
MPFFHVIAVWALLPHISAVFQNHERVRIKLSDAQTILHDLPILQVLNIQVLFLCVSTVSQGSERV